MRNGVIACCLLLLLAGVAPGQGPTLPPVNQKEPQQPLPEWPEIPEYAEPVPFPQTAVEENRVQEPPPAAFAAPVQKPHRFWAKSEYLLWWVDSPHMPALVTTGPTSAPSPGNLGDPLTAIRFGNMDVKAHVRSGGRFALGYWLDDCQQLGIEASGFFLGRRMLFYSQTSPGGPVIARPFFNTATGQDDSSLTTYPGLASGSIVVQSPLSLNGIELNMVRTLNNSQYYPIRAVAGFRYVGMLEDLSIQENSQLAAGAMPYPGRHISVTDRFNASNFFYGGQVGLTAAYRVRRLEIEFGGKVALGATNEQIRIHGQTAIDTQPATNVPAGLLAVASNSGTFSRTVFSVVPEANVNVHLKITPRLRTTVGFSFLYLTNVLRPGDQVDLHVNPAQIPTSNTFGSGGGSAQPAVPLRDTSFWAYGVNLGLEFRF